MPIFEFECKKCCAEYDALAPYDETEKYKGVKCPHCNSTRKNKLVSKINFAFTNPVATDRWCSDAGGHDYRYNYVLPKIKEDRKKAEAEAKRLKVTPYQQIDDISSGENFGEVK